MTNEEQVCAFEKQCDDLCDSIQAMKEAYRKGYELGVAGEMYESNISHDCCTVQSDRHEAGWTAGIQERMITEFNEATKKRLTRAY